MIQGQRAAASANGAAAVDEDAFTGGLFDEDGGGAAWEAASPILTPNAQLQPSQPKKGKKGGHPLQYISSG